MSIEERLKQLVSFKKVKRRLGREVSSQSLKGSHKVSVGRVVTRTTELLFLGMTDSKTRSNN